MVDSLGVPLFPGVVDGADLSFAGGFTNQIADRVRLGNRIQQVQRPFAVSRQSERIDVAGPQSNLYGASAAKSLVLLKTDIESAICSDDIPVTGTSSVGDKMGGLFHWTDVNATTGVWDTSAKQDFRSVGAGLAQDGSVAGTSRFSLNNTLTEAYLRQLVQAVYEAGGKSVSYNLFAGPSLVNTITDFSRAQASVTVGGVGPTLNQNIGDGSMSLSISSWISDYGRIDIIPSLFLRRESGDAFGATGRKSGLLIPKDDTVTTKTMEGITTIELPDVGGGGRRGFGDWMGTVCVLNARALGSFIT